MSKFCYNCGSLIDDGVKFCANCGTPCAAETAPTDQSMQYAAPQPEQQAPQQAQWLTPEPVRQAAPQGPYVVHENAGQQPIYAKPNVPGAPEEKSRMGLGIAVTVGVVLLIAGLIVLFVVVNPFKWWGGSSDSPSTPEELLEATTKIYLTDDADVTPILPYCYEYQFLIDTDKRDELARRCQSMTDSEKAYLTEEFGKLTSFSSTISYSESASDSDKAEGIEHYKENYRTEGIEEFLRAKTELKIVGEKKSDTITGNSYFVKVDGKWYILMNL